MTSQLPRRVTISQILASRYKTPERPVSWDERVSGIDKVRCVDGESLTLVSSGGQSTPSPGWEILLTGECSAAGVSGYSWTLYGIRRS